MSKKTRLGLKWILFAFTLLSLPKGSQAEEPSGGGSSSMAAIEPRNAVSVILMAGLVGGVLGLSTLSFYDRPQDNIRNITIGAGVGMISAALFMTYTVSQAPIPTSFHGAPQIHGPKIYGPEIHGPKFHIVPSIAPEQVGLLASLNF